jgi:cytosine/adenosine deaminase-related metal-dependent hydrolase
MEVKEILNHGLTLAQADQLLDDIIEFPAVEARFQRLRPLTDFRKDDAEARVCKFASKKIYVCVWLLVLVLLFFGIARLVVMGTFDAHIHTHTHLSRGMDGMDGWMEWMNAWLYPRFESLCVYMYIIYTYMCTLHVLTTDLARV